MMKFLAVAASAMCLAGGAQAASPALSDRIPAQFTAFGMPMMKKVVRNARSIKMARHWGRTIIF